MLYYWGRSGPLSCSRSPPFTLVLNEPINHLRLLTVLITLAPELVEQLFTVSASQAINYGDCRQAVTATEPRRRRPSQAQSRFPRENSQRPRLSLGYTQQMWHRQRPLPGDRLGNLIRSLDNDLP